MNKREQENRRNFIAIIEKYCHSCKPIIQHKDIASAMGVTPAMVSYYLRGSRKIPDDHLAAMCIALRLPIRTQKQVYSVLERKMPDYNGFGDEREQIIFDYLEECREDCSKTVSACNAELISKHLVPLTGRRGKQS